MGRRIVAAHDPVRVAPYSFDSVRPHQRIDPRCNAAPIIFHTSKSVDRTERTVRAGRNQQFTGQAGVDRHSRDDALVAVGRQRHWPSAHLPALVVGQLLAGIANDT
jgi:hypothetical protein